MSEPTHNYWRPVAIGLLLCVGITFGLQQCRIDEQSAQHTTVVAAKDKRIGSLQIDSGRIAAQRNDLQAVAAKTRLWGLTVVDSLNGVLGRVRLAASKASARQESQNVIAYYKQQRLVPADYVPEFDANGLPKSDSVMVASANSVNMELETCKQQTRMLSLANASERQASINAEQRTDEERELRMDTQDSNDSLRNENRTLKQQISQRGNRTFWADVKAGFIGFAAGFASGRIVP